MTGKQCDATGYYGPHDAAADDGVNGPEAHDAGAAQATALGNAPENIAHCVASATSAMGNGC